jgi:hypothetical protein
VTDAFQRAEFWKYAKPTGVDPTYGVALALTTLAPQVVNVPDADTAFSTGVPCGNGLLGAVDFGWLDNYLQSTLIPSLASQGVAANTLPIFLLHNVVAYDGTIELLLPRVSQRLCAFERRDPDLRRGGLRQQFQIRGPGHRTSLPRGGRVAE